MNERIENTYTRSGRIANPTEQEILILEAVGLQIRPSRKYLYSKRSDCKSDRAGKKYKDRRFSDVFPKEKWSFQKSSDLFPTISDLG